MQSTMRHTTVEEGSLDLAEKQDRSQGSELESFWRVNVRHCMGSTSTHNIVFVFGHQQASLVSGLYTMMPTQLILHT